ncbi:MAG: hypothetical protein ACREVK_01685 [Gammaproteobacteria bacterium]
MPTKKPDCEALRARLHALKASSDGRLDAQGRSQQEQIAALEDELAGKTPVEATIKEEYAVPVA